MEILTLKNLSFTYPEMTTPALKNLNLSIEEGEFTVICGPSGCGKTTLLRLLKRELSPFGMQEGVIEYKQRPLSECDERTLMEEIGFVFQDPDNQIVLDEVIQEIAFGMENLGYSTFDMRKSVAEMVHFFGVEHLLHAKPSELSGGEKQLVNLLAVLLLKPKVLLLDEPTSQLDPLAAKELVTMLERLNKEMGMTIVVVEHRLEELLTVSDKLLLLQNGKVVFHEKNRQAIAMMYEEKTVELKSYMPSVSRLYMQFTEDVNIDEIPLQVKDCRNWLKGQSITLEKGNDKRINDYQTENPLLTLKNVYFQYKKNTPIVLNNFSLTINEGDFLAIVGGNGSGKTTALRTMIGLLTPQRGSISYRNKKMKKIGASWYKKIAYLPQNPQTYFVHDTVEKEMLETANRLNITNKEKKIRDMLDHFQITHLRHRHPYDCSGGELQRAALACMLLGEPEILFMDEPTKGFDPVAKKRFANLLHTFHQAGMTIIMVTHDIEFAAQHVDRCVMLFDGSVTVDGDPAHLFKGNYFYTTAINRATRDMNIPEVLTIEEALRSWRTPVHY